MKKSDILKAWVELGDDRLSYAEFEREMTRPIRTNSYGVIDIFDLLGWMTRKEDYLFYLTLTRTVSSRRVAKLKAIERRPKYYAAENERRRALAAARRKIRRRSTTNSCPTRESLLEAWEHRKDSHVAAIKFGSMLEDLECYIDNSLRRDEYGAIVGRNPGVKGWLFDNLPDIYDKYTTAMKYKAAAKKLKQIVELSDPTPADVVLPEVALAAEKSGATAQRKKVQIFETQGESAQSVGATTNNAQAEGKRDYGADEIGERGESEVDGAINGCEVGATEGEIVSGEEMTVVGESKMSARGTGLVNRGSEMEVPAVEVVRARAIWFEIVDGVRESAAAIIERLNALTDPERVEEANMLEAWRRKYENEITVRTKNRWWKRLIKKMAG